MRENLFKYHASCFFTHSTIEGLLELQRESPFAAEDVERVTLHVTELELGTCVIPEPSTGLEVKFSLPHLGAMTILGRSTASIDDSDAVDPDSVLLRARVLMVPDGEAGAPTQVEVQLRDANRLAVARDVSRPARTSGHRARAGGEVPDPGRASPRRGGAATLLRALTDPGRAHSRCGT